MAERDTFLDEDEASKNLDNFSTLLLHDMKEHDGELDLMSQFESLAQGLNELHEMPVFTHKKE